MSAILAAAKAFDDETLLLTARERDAYHCLLLAYARQRAPLPGDDARLAIAARVSRRSWVKMRDVIALFFAIEDGLWRHARTDAAIAARQGALAAEQAEREKRAALSATRRAASFVRWERERAAKALQATDQVVVDNGCPSDAPDAKRCKPDDLHMQTPADAHANAHASLRDSSEREIEKTNPFKGLVSQSLDSQEDAKKDANPDFASKRKRRGRKDWVTRRAEEHHAMKQRVMALMQVFEGGGPPRAPPAFADIWRKVMTDLRRQLGDEDFARFILPLDVEAVRDGRVVIACASAYDRDRVLERHGERIANLVHAHEPACMAVDFVVRRKAVNA